MGVIDENAHIRKKDDSNCLIMFAKNTNIEYIIKDFNYECRQGRIAKWYSFVNTSEYIMVLFILEKCYGARIQEYS